MKEENECHATKESILFHCDDIEIMNFMKLRAPLLILERRRICTSFSMGVLNIFGNSCDRVRCLVRSKDPLHLLIKLQHSFESDECTENMKPIDFRVAFARAFTFNSV